MKLFSLFCVLAGALAAFAAPPDAPPTFPAKPGELMTLTVKGKDVWHRKTFTDADVFFARLHSDDAETLNFVVQVKAGRNPKTPLVLFFGSGGEKGGTFTVIDPAGAGTPGEPPTVPPKDPPTDPPAKPTAVYFVLLRANGSPAMTLSNLIKSPEWDKLRTAGHKFRDMTVSEAKAAGLEGIEGVTLPALLRFDPVGADDGGPLYPVKPTKTGPIPTEAQIPGLVN